MAHQQGCKRRSAASMAHLLRRSLFLLCIFLSGLTLGCMTQASYQPDPQRLATLGVAGAQKQLEEVLLRSVNPPINAVEVTDTFVRADLTATTYQIRIFFQDVKKAEVFTNHLVAIRGSDDRILFRPVLANAQDARTFADLMLAMGSR